MKLFSDKVFLASFFATVAGLLGASGIVTVGAEEQAALVEGVSVASSAIGSVIATLRALYLRSQEPKTPTE